MSALEIPHNTLVVVADGEKALLLRATSHPGDHLDLHLERKLTPQDLDNHAPSAKGGGRSENDLKAEDEATFAKQVAQELYTLAQRETYKALIVMADATTLGEMRKSFHRIVTDRIIKEIPKAFASRPIREIAGALEA